MPVKKKASQTEYSSAQSLYRLPQSGMVGGVASGLSVYFGFDVSIIRILFILLTVFGGFGIPLYIILWIVLPSQESQTASEEMKHSLSSFQEKIRSFTASFNHSEEKEQSKKNWALFIIVLGVFLLLNNFNYLSFISLEKLWPLILVVFGFIILSKQS